MQFLKATKPVQLQRSFLLKVTGSIAVISLIRWPFPEKSVETNADTDCYIVDIYDFRSQKSHLCRFLVRNRQVRRRQKMLIYSASEKNHGLIACGFGLRVKGVDA